MVGLGLTSHVLCVARRDVDPELRRHDGVFTPHVID